MFVHRYLTIPFLCVGLDLFVVRKECKRYRGVSNFAVVKTFLLIENKTKQTITTLMIGHECARSF